MKVVFIVFNHLFCAMGLAGSYFSLVEKTVNVLQFFTLCFGFGAAFLFLLLVIIICSD